MEKEDDLPPGCGIALILVFSAWIASSSDCKNGEAGMLVGLAVFCLIGQGIYELIRRWVEYRKRTEPERKRRREEAKERVQERIRLQREAEERRRREREEERRRKRAIADLTDWYEGQKAQLKAVGDEDRESLLLELRERYDQLLKKKIREMEP